MVVSTCDKCDDFMMVKITDDFVTMVITMMMAMTFDDDNEDFDDNDQ